MLVNAMDNRSFPYFISISTLFTWSICYTKWWIIPDTIILSIDLQRGSDRIALNC